MTNCPCHSQKPYSLCCEPLHQGKNCPNAYHLMRSRYSAYALEKADYLISTCHPQNPHYQKNHQAWTETILKFSKATEFRGLEILEFVDGEKYATVTFRAILFQNGQDISFTEKSQFVKEEGKWFYLDGKKS